MIFINPPRGECKSWTDDLLLSTDLAGQSNSNCETVLNRFPEVFEGVQTRFHELVNKHEAKGKPSIKVAYFYEKEIDSVRRANLDLHPIY
jgi:hypothetical protein